MKDKSLALWQTLSANIKKYRELAGLTQEKLAEEEAGISANMVNDIEGCRTWVSDKTLVKLTAALKIETYRLFLPLAGTRLIHAEAFPRRVLYRVLKVIPVQYKSPSDFIARYRGNIDSGKDVFEQDRGGWFLYSALPCG